MRLITVGHGTLDAGPFVALLRDARIRLLVDVRVAPGSRRHPQFRRDAMGEWLRAEAIDYRWERDLGGFRTPAPDSENTALRNRAFRGYADHMRTPAFRAAFDRLWHAANESQTVVMCAESLWWRCHRRLLADAVILLGGVDVAHLAHDGGVAPHRLTEGVRTAGDFLVYDAGAERLV